MFRWNPDQYLRFAGERGRPFADLVARIGAEAPGRVLDLGCGDGGFTATLAQRWPSASIAGIDSSTEMIETASRYAGDRLSFSVADVSHLAPDPGYDVVLSNAMFQWVPDHVDLIQRWAQTLGAGSWFAFQVPGNFSAPSHRLMRSLAGDVEWRDVLGNVLRHDVVLEPAEYAAVFLEEGWTVDAWESTYVHILAGADPVLDWVRGTGLRPVLAALVDADPSGDSSARFQAEYAAALREAYPRHSWGTAFEFRRVFCVANRP